MSYMPSSFLTPMMPGSFVLLHLPSRYGYVANTNMNYSFSTFIITYSLPKNLDAEVYIPSTDEHVL